MEWMFYVLLVVFAGVVVFVLPIVTLATLISARKQQQDSTRELRTLLSEISAELHSTRRKVGELEEQPASTTPEPKPSSAVAPTPTPPEPTEPARPSALEPEPLVPELVEALPGSEPASPRIRQFADAMRASSDSPASTLEPVGAREPSRFEVAAREVTTKESFVEAAPPLPTEEPVAAPEEAVAEQAPAEEKKDA